MYSDSDKQLYDSSEKGDIEQVAKLLTQDGADPDAYKDCRCHDRALHRACYNNHFKIVKLLLKHKADPNAMTVNQFTPLHVSCLHGHLDCVRYLMDSDLCNVDTGTFIDGCYRSIIHVYSFIYHRHLCTQYHTYHDCHL